MLCSAVQCICTVTLLFLSCANENFWIKSEPLNPRAYIWCIEPCHQQKPFNVRLLLKRRSPKRTLVSIFCELKDIMYHKIAWFLNNGYLHHGCFFVLRQIQTKKKPKTFCRTPQAFAKLHLKDRQKWLYSGLLVFYISRLSLSEFSVGVFQWY